MMAGVGGILDLSGQASQASEPVIGTTFRETDIT